MPSKNSINRPKQKINLNRKVQKNAAKRNARESAGLLAPPRSSPESMSGQPKSVPWELFKGQKLGNGPVTTKTLSKKRAKKIERNLKYIEQRKLLEEVQVAKESGMDLDVETTLASKIEKKEHKVKPLEKVKASIWNVLEDTSAQHLTLQTGAGTTLGSQYF